MKICLVRPNQKSRFQITPPLSLGYLSAALNANGYNDIFMVDAALENLSPLQAHNALYHEHPDIIGIQVYSYSHKWVKEFVKYNRDESIIICGGPHISALRETALEYLGVSYGLCGEGEIGIVDFVKRMEDKKKNSHFVDGLISYRGYVKYPPVNLDTYPVPDWELLKPQNYFKYMQGATIPLRGKRPAPIMTSRGCPYNCTFCASRINGRTKTSYRNPQNVIDEIKYLQSEYGIDEIFFCDDNLTADRNKVAELFELMIENKLNIHWRAPNGIRADHLDPFLVEKMAESGCYHVGIGIESGNKNVLKRIKKQLDLAWVRPAIDLLHKYKITVNGFFMLGMLGETEGEIKDSINYSLNIPLDRIQVGQFIPYPGSEDYKIISKHERPFLLQPWFLLQKKLQKIQRNWTLRFYLRPRILISMIRNLKWSQLQAIWIHPWIKKWTWR